MRKPFEILFLFFLVLGVFYPSIFAEPASIDDRQMIQALLNRDGLDWVALFLPASGLYYYRPLIGLSFHADAVLLGSHPMLVHFENVLIHALNTLLLFCILMEWNKKRAGRPDEKEHTPLLLAAFFGLHPLVAEPVNWISGRTDLLACLFVLASFLCFLRNTEKKAGLDIAAALLFLCGLWAKEVAIGLVPVVLFLALQDEGFAIRRRWRAIAGRCLPFLAALLLYVFMRTGGQIGQDIGVMTAVHGGHGAEHFPLAAKMLSLIKAIGFYSQKILWPFPLNFAIVEINRPVALTVGIATLLGLALGLLFLRRRPFLLGLVWIFSFLAPALPVAVNRMAWTPLAERYLYISLAGLCLALLTLLTGRWKRSASLALLALLLGFGAATAQRNIVWQKNLTLWQDVVEKSPNFVAGHNDYGLALLRAGKKAEAEKHLALAASLVGDSSASGRNKVKANLALVKDDLETQVATLETILQEEKNSKQRRQTASQLISLLNRALTEKKGEAAQRREWLAKMAGLHQELFALDKNPYHLYRIGQLRLGLGEKDEARQAFTEVCRSSADYYTGPACTLAEKLAKELSGE